MRLKLKKTITAQEADALINKYYDLSLDHKSRRQRDLV